MYFWTELKGNVTLKPSQMNTEIYTHLKANLIKNLEGKCYKNYGFISKINAITDRSNGVIPPEDPSASAIFNVKFSCKLCNPLKNSFVVGKVHALSSTNYSSNFVARNVFHFFMTKKKAFDRLSKERFNTSSVSFLNLPFLRFFDIGASLSHFCIFPEPL